MKTSVRFGRGMMLISSFAFFSLLVLGSCNKDKDTNTNTTYNISGNANSSQVVPSVSDSASGSISGTYHTNTRVLAYTMTWTNLTGAPTMAAFYTGASGTNGTIIGGNLSLGSGLTATGTFSGNLMLTQDQETQLLTGNWYYIIGTSAHATGEIRGQITATVQ